MQLEDKIALVTGAGRGMGRAISLQLAEAGANIAVSDIDASTAEDTAVAVKQLGRESIAVPADMGDVDDIDRMVRQAKDAFGRIDIIVNNAGVTKYLDIMDVQEDDWDPIILKNKYTGRKVCVEYHQFVLCAKSEKLEVTNIHARLMDKQKNFIIYFADASQFIWFQWHLIKTSGYQNFRIDLKNNLKIPMWNFKVALGEELGAWLDDETQVELQWWQK